MAGYHGYFPQKEAELIEWMDNFIEQTEQNAVAWQIPPAEVASLKTKQAAFKALHTQCAEPNRTKTLTAEKDEAKASLLADAHSMVKFRFANPIITNAIRVQCGLHPLDTIRTPIGEPATRLEFDLKVTDIRQVAVDFWDQGSASKAKPYGMNGAVISWALLDHVPAGPEELTKAVLATRTPYTLEFSEEERGGTVYVALQWQNEAGKKGRPSEILSTVVP
jgi:hypothetical protein